MSYQFVKKNGIQMIELSVINETGIAEGYCTTRYGGISRATPHNCQKRKSMI